MCRGAEERRSRGAEVQRREVGGVEEPIITRGAEEPHSAPQLLCSPRSRVTLLAGVVLAHLIDILVVLAASDESGGQHG
jgi:hypothetical protein